MLLLLLMVLVVVIVGNCDGASVGEVSGDDGGFGKKQKEKTRFAGCRAFSVLSSPCEQYGFNHRASGSCHPCEQPPPKPLGSRVGWRDTSAAASAAAFSGGCGGDGDVCFGGEYLEFSSRRVW